MHSAPLELPTVATLVPAMSGSCSTSHHSAGCMAPATCKHNSTQRASLPMPASHRPLPEVSVLSVFRVAACRVLHCA
eukprot:7246680-Alexandrium_andersonii.AAC.1